MPRRRPGLPCSVNRWPQASPQSVLVRTAPTSPSHRQLRHPCWRRPSEIGALISTRRILHRRGLNRRLATAGAIRCPASSFAQTQASFRPIPARVAVSPSTMRASRGARHCEIAWLAPRSPMAPSSRCARSKCRRACCRTSRGGTRSPVRRPRAPPPRAGPDRTAVVGRAGKFIERGRMSLGLRTRVHGLPRGQSGMGLATYYNDVYSFFIMSI
jgi:hypothetical protein